MITTIKTNPKARQVLYGSGTISLGVVALLAALKIFDPAFADKISDLIPLVLSLFGTGALGTARAVVKGQINNGSFDPAPEPEPTPVDQATNGLQAVAGEFGNLISTVTSGLQTIQQTAAGLGSMVPGVGGASFPLAGLALPGLIAPTLPSVGPEAEALFAALRKPEGTPQQ